VIDTPEVERKTAVLPDKETSLRGFDTARKIAQTSVRSAFSPIRVLRQHLVEITLCWAEL